MVKGTQVIEDPRSGIRILISRPAQTRIGPGNVNEFARLLRNVMEALGAETAYVSRRGASIEISVIRSDGWRGTMKVRRG